METPKEATYFENRYKIHSEYINHFIGKTCFISFIKAVSIPFYSYGLTLEIKGIIKSNDGYYLNVLIPTKKKNYLCILTLNNIASIAAEESS